MVSSSQQPGAGKLRFALTGTRDGRATSYQLKNDLSVGDKVQRDVLALSWRTRPTPDWRISATPRIEFRKDRTFDRDLEEWRGSGLVSARRSGILGPTVELGAGYDFLRTRGDGADFLLDRNALRAFASVGAMPLFGPEWRLGYGLYAVVGTVALSLWVLSVAQGAAEAAREPRVAVAVRWSALTTRGRSIS